MSMATQSIMKRSPNPFAVRPRAAVRPKNVSMALGDSTRAIAQAVKQKLSAAREVHRREIKIFLNTGATFGGGAAAGFLDGLRGGQGLDFLPVPASILVGGLAVIAGGFGAGGSYADTIMAFGSGSIAGYAYRMAFGYSSEDRRDAPAQLK